MHLDSTIKMHQNTASQIRSFVLPLTALVVIPLFIIVATKSFRFGWGLGMPYDAVAVCIGLSYRHGRFYIC